MQNSNPQKTNEMPEVVKELLLRSESSIPGDKQEAARKLLVDTAFKKFLKFGTRRVTMDEIARDLRMSKKRIYEFYPSKEALVKACLDQMSMVVLPRMLKAFSSGGSVSERFLSMQKTLADLSAVITSEFVTDLKLEFPHLWEVVNERRRFVISNFESVIEEGIKSGEIWPNVHPGAAMSIIMNTVLNVVSPEALSTGEFTPRQALYTMLTIIGRGLFINPIAVDQFFNSEVVSSTVTADEKVPL